jgi:hypothetical protein
VDDRVVRNVRAELRCATAENGVDCVAIDQHHEYHAGPFKYLGRICRDGCARRSQGVTPVSGTVPHNELCTRTGQIERHGLSHDT